MKPTILLLAIMLTGCSAEKRLQKLLRDNPELSRVDTITVTDTIYTAPDTIWRSIVIRSTDTVTVESERQSVKLVRVPTGSPCDTAAIALDLVGIVKPDTIYNTVTVEVDRIVPCPPGTRVHHWWRTAALVCAVLALAMFLLYRYPPNHKEQ